MIFLAGADKRRYGKMVEDLNNSYLAKKDNYPTSISDVLTLLSHYQDHKTGVHNVGNSEDSFRETSFAQRQSKRLSKVRCYECNELGHIKPNCPRLQKQNHNQTGSDDGSRSNGVGSVFG